MLNSRVEQDEKGEDFGIVTEMSENRLSRGSSMFGLANQTPKPPIKRDSFVGTSYLPIHNYYKIGEKIGEGSWGAVYVVEERCSNIIRAAKKIPKQFSGEIFRFRQEIQLLSVLDHPNIAKLYETFEDYNSIYLIMELCNGGELFDRLSKIGYFSERVTAHLIKQMLSAISYCHSKGIVHRDLKPENFLFLNPKSEIECKHCLFELKSNNLMNESNINTRDNKDSKFRLSRSLPSSLNHDELLNLRNDLKFISKDESMKNMDFNFGSKSNSDLNSDSLNCNCNCNCFELNSPLKLIDFGLAKRITRTRTLRTRVGTLYYIAPEVLIGRGYDDKCDIWSIGVMTHILLCGVPPFTGNTDVEIIERVRKGSISFNESIWTQVSAQAKDFLLKLLNKNSSERISAFQALQHPWLRSWDPPNIPLCGIGMINKIVVWPWHQQRLKQARSRTSSGISNLKIKSSISSPSLYSNNDLVDEILSEDSEFYIQDNQKDDRNNSHFKTQIINIPQKDESIDLKFSNRNSLLKRSCSTPLLYSMNNAYPNTDMGLNNNTNASNLFNNCNGNNNLIENSIATPRTKATINALLNQEDSILSPPCDPRFHFGCHCGNPIIFANNGNINNGKNRDCKHLNNFSRILSSSSSSSTFTTSYSTSRSSFSYTNLLTYNNNTSEVNNQELNDNNYLSSLSNVIVPNIIAKVCNKEKLFYNIINNKARNMYKPLLKLINSWERFCKYTLLKRVILVSIALRIGENSDFNGLKQQFNKLDVAADGVVSLAELQCVLCLIFHIELISINGESSIEARNNNNHLQINKYIHVDHENNTDENASEIEDEYLEFLDDDQQNENFKFYNSNHNKSISIDSYLSSFSSHNSFNKESLLKNLCIFNINAIIKLNELCNRIENIFGIIDQDQSGSWEYTEFIAASMQPETYLNNINALRTVFRNFDKDSDGKVSVQDILASFGWEDDIILCSETISPQQYEQYLRIGNSQSCDLQRDDRFHNNTSSSVQYCAHIHWTEIFLNECCKPEMLFMERRLLLQFLVLRSEITEDIWFLFVNPSIFKVNKSFKYSDAHQLLHCFHFNQKALKSCNLA